MSFSNSSFNTKNLTEKLTASSSISISSSSSTSTANFVILREHGLNIIKNFRHGEPQIDAERTFAEYQQAIAFLEELSHDKDAFDLIKLNLVQLLEPKRIAASLPAAGSSLVSDHRKLNNARDITELNNSFMDILYLPFGLNHLGKNHRRYEEIRGIARLNENNYCDPIRDNGNSKTLFQGTQYRPYVRGFSMHAYTFASYLSVNNNSVTPESLELIILFFYANYLRSGHHSFAEIDAAFIRVSEEDAAFKKLDLLSVLAPTKSAVVSVASVSSSGTASSSSSASASSSKSIQSEHEWSMKFKENYTKLRGTGLLSWGKSDFVSRNKHLSDFIFIAAVIEHTYNDTEGKTRTKKAYELTIQYFFNGIKSGIRPG